MEPSDDDPEEDLERALRLGELRAEVEKLTGETPLEGGAENVPLEVQEEFWEKMLAYESAPSMRLDAFLWERLGFRPTPLDAVIHDAAKLRKALWELIGALASVRHYLECTDHLSDLELYDYLVRKLLPEETTAFPEGMEWNCHIDVSGGSTGDPVGLAVYLQYYADESERATWAEDFPEDEIPPKREKPYDRDVDLPVPDAVEEEEEE